MSVPSFEYAVSPQDRPGAVYEYARTLIGQGADPAALLHTSRDGVKCLMGKLDTFARFAWKAATDPHPGLWYPHYRANIPAPLAEWHVGVLAAREDKRQRRQEAATK